MDFFYKHIYDKGEQFLEKILIVQICQKSKIIVQVALEVLGLHRSTVIKTTKGILKVFGNFFW